MTDSETEEEGWDGGSGDEGQSEECHDEVVVVEASGSRVSVKPILCFYFYCVEQQIKREIKRIHIVREERGGHCLDA